MVFVLKKDKIKELKKARKDKRILLYGLIVNIVQSQLISLIVAALLFTTSGFNGFSNYTVQYCILSVCVFIITGKFNSRYIGNTISNIE